MKRLTSLAIGLAMCALVLAQVYDGTRESAPAGSTGPKAETLVGTRRSHWMTACSSATSRAEGWFTVNTAGPSMVWDMRVVSNYYGFPDRLTARFTQR